MNYLELLVRVVNKLDCVQVLPGLCLPLGLLFLNHLHLLPQQREVPHCAMASEGHKAAKLSFVKGNLGIEQFIKMLYRVQFLMFLQSK